MIAIISISLTLVLLASFFSAAEQAAAAPPGPTSHEKQWWLQTGKSYAFSCQHPLPWISAPSTHMHKGEVKWAGCVPEGFHGGCTLYFKVRQIDMCLHQKNLFDSIHEVFCDASEAPHIVSHWIEPNEMVEVHCN